MTLAIGLLAVAGIAATGALAGKGLKTKQSTTTIGPVPDIASVAATCKKKHQAVSGGWSATLDITLPDQSAIFALESRRDGKRRWTNTAVNLGNASSPYTAYAYCRKQKVKTKTKGVTAPANTTTPTTVASTAKCKKKQRAVSGGFDGDLDLTGPGTTLILIGDSHRVGKRKWRAEGANLGDQAGTLTAQVNCVKGKKKIKQRQASASFGTTLVTREVEAKCRRKERVVSGGFKLDRPHDANSAQVFLSTFRKQGTRKWVAEAAGATGSGTATLTLIAYCEKKK